MCGVAVTEPDYGSDVAGVKVTATRDGDDWVINGVKTWCTFAGRPSTCWCWPAPTPTARSATAG
jgi:alkylation response protein AidB-like acyl-CoA dehydrogenase